MKTKIFLALILLICTSQIHAQNKRFEEKLIGIWQMNAASYSLNIKGKQVFLKEYKADKTFQNLALANGMVMAVTAYGTYEITSDSTVVEAVEKSLFMPGENKKGNLKIKFSDDGDKMLLFYKVDESMGEEMWQRVKYPEKTEHNSAM